MSGAGCDNLSPDNKPVNSEHGQFILVHVGFTTAVCPLKAT